MKHSLQKRLASLSRGAYHAKEDEITVTGKAASIADNEPLARVNVEGGMI